jgi:urea carboxylase
VSEIVLEEADAQSELDLPEGAQAVSAHVTGTVWKLLIKEGQRVEMGKPVVVIESMKMEFAVDAPVSGTVQRFFCKEGTPISAGQVLLIIQEE